MIQVSSIALTPPPMKPTGAAPTSPRWWWIAMVFASWLPALTLVAAWTYSRHRVDKWTCCSGAQAKVGGVSVSRIWSLWLGHGCVVAEYARTEPSGARNEIVAVGDTVLAHDNPFFLVESPAFRSGIPYLFYWVSRGWLWTPEEKLWAKWDAICANQLSEIGKPPAFINPCGPKPAPPPDRVGRAPVTSAAIIIHVLYLAGLFLAWPLPIWLIGRYRVRKPKESMCAKCGYDLRATPERCPECGTVPKKIGTGRDSPIDS